MTNKKNVEHKKLTRQTFPFACKINMNKNSKKFSLKPETKNEKVLRHFAHTDVLIRNFSTF